MNHSRKGISLIALIITIAIIVIIATVTIQNGLHRTDDAKLAKHNTNISITQEEVESYYYYKNGSLPTVNLTPYPIALNSTLYSEIVKNAEETDDFYILDFKKLGKASGKEGTGIGDDIYIVSKTKHNIYYVKGIIVKGLVYHGLAVRNTGNIIQSASLTPTIGATFTPTNTLTPTTTPTPDQYSNPVIPTGFAKVGSETWENGFTIQDSNGNQFVWVPALDPRVQANGTLDGTTFTSKFGRRRFRGETFNASNYYETNDTNLQNMTASINKYGGFYIAKYEASNNGSGKGQSKANKTPWTSIDWDTSKSKAESMDTDWAWDTSAVESYLCYEAHWDTTLQWLINSGAKTSLEITSDSSSWGNYSNDTFSGDALLGPTGVWSQACVKGIYDLAGNAWEWTMGNCSVSYRTVRGGCYIDNGSMITAAHRTSFDPSFAFEPIISWRAVLYIK